MTGVVVAPGVIAVTWGDDEPCSECGKFHPVDGGPTTRAKINDLFKELRKTLDAQKDKIKRLSAAHAESDDKAMKAAKFRKRLGKGQKLTADEATEHAGLEVALRALDAEIQALEAFFQGSAVLRWDENNNTYSKGYMIGVMICVCESRSSSGKKLAACSSKAPPGFVAAVASIGYELASSPAVPRTDPRAKPEEWECAAKQLMEKAQGHKPAQMIESLFMPAIGGLKLAKGPPVTFDLTESGVTRKVTLRFKNGEDVPSCDKCQKRLPALYCKNTC